jgi:hypothetical protein
VNDSKQIASSEVLSVHFYGQKLAAKKSTSANENLATETLASF